MNVNHNNKTAEYNPNITLYRIGYVANQYGTQYHVCFCKEIEEVVYFPIYGPAANHNIISTGLMTKINKKDLKNIYKLLVL